MTNFTQTKTRMVPVDANILITPSDRKNIYYFDSPIANGEYNISCVTTNVEFGDELMIILTREPGEDNLVINFPEEVFYMTYCGDSINTFTMTNNPVSQGSVQADQWVLTFFYNGTKFLSTWDTG